jgi:superfamily II DNA or RNA helicase
VPDLSGVATLAGDYKSGALAAAMDRPAIVGDAIGHYRTLCRGKRAVVFAAGVSNSQNIVAQFNAAGIPAEHVDGSMQSAERDAIVDRFRRGETLILSNADLFGEGFDVPAIEAVILLRPTKSLSLYLQQVGRALRPMAGKDVAIILDHAGNSLRHGLPDDVREWSLEDREKRAKREALDVPVRQCEECFFVYRPAPKCPQCGHAPAVVTRELEQIEGTLEEVKRVAKWEKKAEQAKAQTLEDLIALGRARGYKNPVFWAQRVHGNRGARWVA